MKNPQRLNDKLEKAASSRILFSYKILLILLTLVFVAVSIVTIWNAAHLQQAINKRTYAYVTDVSLQLSTGIDFRLADIRQDLDILADSLEQLDSASHTENLIEFLIRKADILIIPSLLL